MYFDRIFMCLKPFLNGLSFFLGVLFLGLMSCSSATDSTSSSPSGPTEDNIPPTVAISTNQNLEIGKIGTITFAFSENVNNFTPDDIQFLPTGFSVEKGKFVTNNQKSYSLQITPKLTGTLTVTVPDKSFEDLSGNQNTNTFSTNFSVEDKTPPTVNISSEALIEGESAYLSFIFSENVNNFTPDDIQFLSNKANGVNNVVKGNFVTNSQKSYSLQITPKEEGILYVSIPAKSFEDLSGNKNDKAYSSDFMVLDSNTVTYTISFKLNGGSFISPQITNLKVVSGKAIEETKLEKILSYPPTGPKPDIEAVTRGIFEWRTTNGTKYELSTLVSSDLTLEAVWSNSCGKIETVHPADRNALQNYVNAAIGANATTNLNHIDTSAITDMNNLFWLKNSFNGEIGCWNTAKVNNMNSMFSAATAFNQDISRWDVGNATTMAAMFAGANAFNQDIGSWDVANVTAMSSMFNQAYAFNQDISRWNVAKVTYMNRMFSSASAFNQDISRWNVANVTAMSSMFNQAYAFNQDISRWNVAKVTYMNGMFSSASAFNQDISRWNVANVTAMSSMFNQAYAFNQDISRWNVANVTAMSSMFNNAFAFNQDISTWNVANVTSMRGMFANANVFNQDISSWNVANVTDTSSMFSNATAFNKDISSWNVANVNNMNNMFSGAAAFNQDISSWNVANVTDMSYMFSYASAFDQDLSKWSVSNLIKYTNTFNRSAMEGKINQYPKFPDRTPPTVVTISINESLEKDKTRTITFTFSENVTNFTPDDVQFLPIGVSGNKGKFVTNNLMSYSLQITPKLVGTLTITIPANSFEDLSGNQNTKNYTSNFKIDLTSHIISFKLNGGSFKNPQITNLKVISISNTAIEQTKLGEILSYPPTGPKPGINSVTRSIFEWRTNGTKYELSNLVSSDLTLEAVWRNSCGKVETFHPTNRNELKTYTDKAIIPNDAINLNHIDTSAITDMNHLFDFKSTFNGNMYCWNTANVNNMSFMFKNVIEFNQDISSWNVANVTDMGSMFFSATEFNKDISSWNVVNVDNMNSMFKSARAFNQDISSWDVANVNNMHNMFFNADAFNQDISSWNVANVNNMQSMFFDANAFNQDLSSWSVSNVTRRHDMFTHSPMENKTNQHPKF